MMDPIGEEEIPGDETSCAVSRRPISRQSRGRVGSVPGVAGGGGGGGNTTDVIGVGATVTDVIAINDANDKIQVGA